MNTITKVVLGILVIIGGCAVGQHFYPRPTPLGSSSENSNTSITESSEYNQIGLTGSRSQQAVVSAGPGRVYSVQVTSDATSLRYLQLFDLAQASVPTRAASMSSKFSLVIYKASLSWAATTALNGRPLGSYQQYASPSLVHVIPIPPATASSSPTVVRVNSSDFAPAKYFSKGIMFVISSVFGSYSSASVTTARHTIRVNYK